MQQSKLRTALPPAAFLAIALAPNLVTTTVTRRAVNGWYRAIRKPRWNPPAWVFGPVWTTLYVLIGVAGSLVWRRREHRGGRAALAAWGAQMALNHAWTPLFFGQRRIGLAALEILVMWKSIAAFILASWRVSRPAALLFVPYLVWVTFASALNIRIWMLNRTPEDSANPRTR